MKNSYRKVSKKVVALIVEISLIIICSIVVLILDATKHQINIFIWVGIYAALIFALLLTLSFMRFDRLRELRSDFKDTNLPIYTDQTTLMMHEIKDEEEKHDQSK